MRTPVPRTVLALMGLFAVTSCGDVAVDPAVSVFATGVVSDSASHPVARALVRVYEGLDAGSSCQVSPTLADIATDSMGVFGVRLSTISDRDEIGCLRVVVQPPASSSLRPDSVDVPNVVFGRTEDTVRVNVTLRAQ